MSTLTYKTEVKYIPFPLLAVKLKDYEKRLSDATWDEDKSQVEKLKKEIYNIQVQISLGEKYDIPF
jgi:hypothetical protein